MSHSYVSYVRYADSFHSDFTQEVGPFYVQWNTKRGTQHSKRVTGRVLTLKTGVPERFATETFVILHSVDDDWPTKYVCKNKNVGLLQAGSRL